MSVFPGNVPPREYRERGALVRVGAATRQSVEENRPEPVYTTNQYIGFSGHTQTGEHRTLEVLAGEGAPTIAGGWVKVANVPRFQRVGFTVPEGYDPITMTVPVQFEAVALYKRRKNLEADIQTLEWMAGRYPVTSGKEIKGEPPYIEVFTTNSSGQTIALVPTNYQGKPGASRQWYMTNIAYDPNPYRDTEGARLRQKATVTLMEIVSTPGTLKRNREAREEVKGRYEIIEAQSGETIRQIARRIGFPDAWETIAKYNHTPAEKKLKARTKIKVPLEVFRQVPA